MDSAQPRWLKSTVPDTLAWAERCFVALAALDPSIDQAVARALANDMAEGAHWRAMTPEAAVAALDQPCSKMAPAIEVAAQFPAAGVRMDRIEVGSSVWAQSFVKHLGELRPEIELSTALLLCVEAFERFPDRSPALVAEWVAVTGSVPS